MSFASSQVKKGCDVTAIDEFESPARRQALFHDGIHTVRLEANGDGSVENAQVLRET